MMCPKLALIFGEYNSPNQPYLKSWLDQLSSSENLIVRAFTTRYTPSTDVEKLGNIPKQQKLARLIKFSVQNPKIATQLIGRKMDPSIYHSMRRIAEYSPLYAFQPDVVHFVNSYLFTSFASQLPIAGAKSIVSFRGYDIVVRPWNDQQWMKTLQSLFSKVDILHFVSYYLQDEAIKLGALKSKCRVIYPSSDITDNANLSSNTVSDGKIRLVTTGRLTWQKGYPQALLAVKMLICQGVQVDYSILGDGGEIEHLTHMIRVLGIGDHVHLKGYQTQEEVRKALIEADIYFHPSETESISVAIMEALLMGKAIVASNVGGIPEAVEDGVTGLLVPPYDIEAMANAIRKLIDSPDLRLNMGLSALKKAKEQFSVEREFRDWENLYSEMCKA